MKWSSIAGRSKNGWIDFYQTPSWVIEKLLDHLPLHGEILEPASGAWAISKVLESRWYTVISQDLRTDEWVYGTKGKNFFLQEERCDTIITNPPYFCAKDFILKSLEIANTVVMLLKLQFLESVDRYKFFQDTPLKTVYVICKRVTMYPEWEKEPENSWTIAYAWYVWEKRYTWKPTIEWII